MKQWNFVTLYVDYYFYTVGDFKNIHAEKQLYDFRFDLENWYVMTSDV